MTNFSLGSGFRGVAKFFLIFCFVVSSHFLVAQQVSGDVDFDSDFDSELVAKTDSMPYKHFSFNVGVGNYRGVDIDGISLMIFGEKGGKYGLPSYIYQGSYLRFQKSSGFFSDFYRLGSGLRFTASIIPLIEDISDQDFGVKKVEFYAGLMAGYDLVVYGGGNGFDISKTSGFGIDPVFGIRGYLAEGLGFHAEFGRSTYRTITLGINFRKFRKSRL